jgi:hypothetical protein
MSTSDDASAGFRALHNQIPIEMEASHVILDKFVALSSLYKTGQQPPTLDGEAVTLEKCFELLFSWMTVTTYCAIMLDSKIEQLAGRPGVPDGLVGAIMSEFNAGT